ncbi:hypothetical protein CERZMDRAFT_98809 [Cercospora zeae-maydis SCOH1-5]|uniref:Uncharacterized protein n=1 Tax=Cercospora zeae-maydis SCOH1-5 TaxID=717836 RepID=A0A6A6FCF5_9PEZI|nr:hypothetical protein CERZMDRAFT_98809 [Cercospora zeae-maydis SCOH1-5]
MTTRKRSSIVNHIQRRRGREHSEEQKVKEHAGGRRTTREAHGLGRIIPQSRSLCPARPEASMLGGYLGFISMPKCDTDCPSHLLRERRRSWPLVMDFEGHIRHGVQSHWQPGRRADSQWSLCRQPVEPLQMWHRVYPVGLGSGERRLENCFAEQPGGKYSDEQSRAE